MAILKVRNNARYYRLRCGYSQREVAALSSHLLFSVSGDYAEELDAGIVGEGLGAVFEEHGIVFGERPVVRVKRRGCRWQIRDPKYVIARNGRGGLDVYDPGIDESTVSKVERGVIVMPHSRTLQALSRVYGVEPYKIITPLKFG